MIEIIKGGHKETRTKEETKWTKSGYVRQSGKLKGNKIDYSKVMKDTAKPKYSLGNESK